MVTKHVLPPPERRAFGQSQRKQVRRQEQNRWRSSDRQTDPMDALAASAVGRVPALLAIKYAADGGFTLWVFSRRRAGHGRRPGSAAPYRHFYPAMR